MRNKRLVDHTLAAIAITALFLFQMAMLTSPMSASPGRWQSHGGQKLTREVQLIAKKGQMYRIQRPRKTYDNKVPGVLIGGCSALDCMLTKLNMTQTSGRSESG